MSASTGPDEHPYTAQHSQNPQDQSLSAKEESPFAYDPDYVPEREFVLMPLFRRIGDMLGLRRRDPEPQLIEAEPLEKQEQVYSAGAEIPHAQPQEPGPAEWEALPAMPSLAAQAEPELHHDAFGQDLLDSESDLLESAIASREIDPETELHAERVHSEAAEQQIQPLSVGEEQPAAELSAPLSGQAAEESRNVQSAAVTDQIQDASRVETGLRPPTAEEIQQLVAPLRDAAAKISATVAQAAEWLRSAEEELLRRVEGTRQTTAPAESDPAVTVVPFEAHTLIASTPIEPEVVTTEAPGIQREAAWQQRPVDEFRQPPDMQPPAPIYRNQDHPALKPRLEVVPPRPPFWRRIDWAQEFTPKRVAVLGGLAMAVLLVLGISLARRPASSLLPEQQQTRSLQPGGVTVTTHPAPARQVSAQPGRRNAAPERPSPGPQHPRHVQRSAEDDNSEPEVVTHYYNGKKPSPVKQTTVAGVRHYSDM